MHIKRYVYAWYQYTALRYVLKARALFLSFLRRIFLDIVLYRFFKGLREIALSKAVFDIDYVAEVFEKFVVDPCVYQ